MGRLTFTSMIGSLVLLALTNGLQMVPVVIRQHNRHSNTLSSHRSNEYDVTTTTTTTTTENQKVVSRSTFLISSLTAAVATMTTPTVASADTAPLTSSSSTADTSSSMMVSKTTELAKQESISGFIAGAALTMTKTLVKYPLDTATVRLQMPNSQYSVFNIIELFNGSYRGVLAPLITNIPAAGVFFAVKDAVKVSLTETTNLSRWEKTCIAVAIAQIPYWLVRNPSEVVKTRQQANLPGYVDVSALDAYKKVREDRILQSNNSTNLSGLDAFYTGYVENILYAYPADVIKFVCYEQITQGRKNLPPLEGAIAGAIATGIAQFITTPLDVVRNRVMAEKTIKNNDNNNNNDDDDNNNNKQGYLNSLIQIAKNEGINGLFAGTVPRVGKAIVSGAIQFATYEETKKDIAKWFEKRSS